jgi:hypothetical protein
MGGWQVEEADGDVVAGAGAEYGGGGAFSDLRVGVLRVVGGELS